MNLKLQLFAVCCGYLGVRISLPEFKGATYQLFYHLISISMLLLGLRLIYQAVTR